MIMTVTRTMTCVTECAPEFRDKFFEYVKGIKTGVVKYEEEFRVDRTAGTAQLFVIVNGQRIKDHGLIKAGVENEHVFDDGRPTKVGYPLTF